MSGAYRSICVLALVFVIACCVVAQESSSPSDLIQKIQISESSDGAASQLIKLGKSDSQDLAFIAVHLPAIIEKNPHDFPEQWTNAVKVAGELKIVEASPALGKWV